MSESITSQRRFRGRTNSAPKVRKKTLNSTTHNGIAMAGLIGERIGNPRANSRPLSSPGFRVEKSSFNTVPILAAEIELKSNSYFPLAAQSRNIMQAAVEERNRTLPPRDAAPSPGVSLSDRTPELSNKDMQALMLGRLVRHERLSFTYIYNFFFGLQM